MADSKLIDLPAATTPLDGTELVYLVQGGNDRKATTQNFAGSLLGSTTLTGATVTADAPVLNMTQSWNNAGVTFTGLKFNVPTDTSAAGSLLLDLQVGGSSFLSVQKNGTLRLGYSGNGNGFDYNSVCVLTGTGSSTSLKLNDFGRFGFTNGFASAALDTILTRRGPANLRLGAADTTGTTAPTAQTLSVQSWASSTNNNQPGANFTIDGSQGTGTGAGGSIVFRVAPAGATANGVQNALATALTIASDRAITIPGTAASIGIRIPVVPYGLIQFNDNNASIGSDVSSNLSAACTSFNLSSSSAYYAISNDVRLYRDAANTLALRNGANAQKFSVYNTFTDASNYERGVMDWTTDANFLRIGTQWAGTGSGRSTILHGSVLYFYTGGTTNGTNRWNIDGSGNFLASTDNTYDIGASGANRPRNLYVANNIVGNNDVFVAGSLRNSTKGIFAFSSDGVFAFYNAAATDFGRLQFGGTTASFPALKRSSTTLQARLADDSAFASVQGKLTTDTAYTAGAPTATGYIIIYDSTGTAYRVPAVAN